MKKKVIFLFLALLLPVAIFIFLKTFGRNEFQVPVMYEQDSVPPAENCPFDYPVPYTIPDSVFATLGLNRDDSLYVFYFDPALNIALNRISVEFKEDPIQLINPAALRTNPFGAMLEECILLMGGDSSVALVDRKNRIRGYYNGADRDEVDRLVVEMKIILKKY